jgi:two-component system LytT family response regulator
MKVKALIVDDEPLARERIRSLLAREEGVVVTGECACGEEALTAIRRERPDVVFLDVQMPEMDGFEVLRRLESPLPRVVFVTAYDRHALKAFDVHALDYLLKPFKQDRFKETMTRIRETLATSEADAASRRLLDLLAERQPAAPHLSRLVIKDGERVRVVKTEAIDWIESSGNYLVVHAGKENHIVRDTLTAMESKLAPGCFMRISRSTLVNLDRIREIQPMFNDEHIVVLQDGRQLPMTRGLREVQEALKFS